MPFKSVEVALKLGISGFTAPLGAATAQVRQFSAQAGQAAKQFGADVSAAARDGSGNLEKVGKASTIVGGVMLAGFGLAAKATMGFEQELSNLQAVSGATSEEMSKLRDQAIEAGAATSFSAGEAAQAQTELAKAGVSTADILGGGLEGALALAAAGNLDLARAAELSANAMTTFGLKGADVGRIADALAAGANKSAADVEDVGAALQQTGLVADQFGLTLEETVGVLSMFAQAGLKGSDAGTSMKTMLQRLIPQSDEAKETMQQLGIEMFDAQGNFVGIDKAAQELQDGLSGLTQEQRAAAMQTIFGADAIRAATIIYGEGGQGVRDWTEQVTDSGYASEVAAEKLDNLAGDLEGLKGSIETALIQGGSKATGVLRFLAQTATSAVNSFSSLPGPVQTGAIAIMGFAGTALTVGGAVATMAPKILAARTALEGMGVTGMAASRALGAIGAAVPYALAIAAVAYAIHRVSGGANKLTVDLDTLAASLDDTTRAGRESLEADIRKADQFDVLDEMIAKVADENFSLAESLMDVIENMDLEHTTVAELNDIIAQKREEDIKGEAASREHAEAVDEGVAALEGQEGALDGSTGAMLENAEATEEATKALQEHMDQLRAQYDPLFGMVDALQGVEDAQSAVREAELNLAAVRADSESTALDIAAAEQELADAQRDTGTAAYEAELAAWELKDAMENQGLTLEGATAKLQDWVEQGFLTREQALLIAQDFHTVAGKEQEITDTPANAHVSSTGVPRTRTELASVRDTAHSIPDRHTTTTRTSGTREARNNLTSVRDAALSIPNSVSIGVHVGGEVGQFLAAAAALGQSSGGIVEFARGGMAIQRYAGGGESHIAQIARPGTMRLWAEPETGGEAYIPLANDWRRPRAVSVLEETARRFGRRVVPAGATGGDTYMFDVSVTVPVSASMTAMDMARVEDMASRATRSALSQVMAGVG